MSHEAHCIFPSLNNGNTGEESRRTVDLNIRPETVSIWETGLKSTSLVRAVKISWALLLEQYNGAALSVFGVVEEATNPSRITAGVEHWQLIESRRGKLSDVGTCAHFETWWDADAGPNDSFNTCVLVRSQRCQDPKSIYPYAQVAKRVSICGLAITLLHSKSLLSISLEYSTSIAGDSQAWAILTAFSHIFECMIVHPNAQVESINVIGERNMKTISSWNNCGLVDNSEHCIHDLIMDQCAKHPEAEAVRAHDGSLTYAELDRLSDRLKARLLSRGVLPESIVPVCFEKSVWTAVSILGILKARGAFLLLDPSHPFSRHVGVCDDVKASFVVTSPSLNRMCVQLAQNTVVMPDDILSDPIQSEHCSHQLPSQPETVAYIAYTSGSTGKPKGIAIEHRSFCSSAIAHSKVQNLTKQSRVLQFASYSFDVSIQEMLTTLMVGGCVCVPSEAQRLNNLAGAIVELGANWVELTPSVARLLSPEEIPQVTTLVLGGESMVPSDIALWSDHVQLMVAYGPAECSIVSTVQPNVRLTDLYNIGRSYGGRCWVVDDKDERQLRPIGAIGELVISGPIVGRGYINQLDQDVFIDSPPWSSDFAISPKERFYRTGDLVRYNAEDGTLQYIGRKDRQVKINGQRVELQEIEQCAEKFAGNLRAVVDVISPHSTKTGKVLALFLVDENVPYQGEPDAPITRRMIDHDTQKQLSDMKHWLSEKLPRFMVPTLYIPINGFPLAHTGKLNRKLLREIAIKSLPPRQEYTDAESPLSGTRSNGDLEIELSLKRAYSEVLSLPMDRIGLHDGLFSLGGNSITAIELVAKAREQGLEVTIANILTLQSVAGLAAVVRKSEAVEPIKAFGLMVGESLYHKEAAEVQCKLKKGAVEDMYPCTPLQEGLISLSDKIPGSFIAKFVFHLPSWVDIGLFKTAVERVFFQNPIMRTRIVQMDNKLFQVVAREEIRWIKRRSLDEYACGLATDQGFLGAPLTQFAIVGGEDKAPLFALSMHHAVFDGWSYLQLLSDIQDAYEGHQIPQRPHFNRFIDFVSKLDVQAVVAFWTNEFAGIQSPVFPIPPIGWTPPAQWSSIKQSIPLMEKSGDQTLASLVKLAWALVISCQTNSNDVAFGMTVSGRNSAVAGIEKISGPTIATFPWRIQLQPYMSVEKTLKNIHEHDISLIPFEQTGMQRIQHCSSEAAIACKFQTLLVIQPQPLQSPSTILVDSTQNMEQQHRFSSHVLTCVAHLGNDSLELEAVFDEAALSYQSAQMLLSQFEIIFGQIVVNPTMKLSAIQQQSNRDREQIIAWNMNGSFAEPRCMHDLIGEFGKSQPNREAVCAWDGNFSYSELVKFSRSVAGYLQSFHVGAETVVAICMERSKWVPAAALGVLMAGAAFVLLEPAFPIQRLESICQESAAAVAILTSTTLSRCGKLAKNTIVLTEEVAVQAGSMYTWEAPLVTTKNAMYIAFTSGSTGKPKGVVIEHGMCYSTFCGFADRTQMSSKSRVLYFSSPAFDASIHEIIFTLAAGGCVCIPSESQRLNGVGKAIATLDVNWLSLTPTVSRTLAPDEIPSVHTLVLIGEPLAITDIITWANRVELRVAYGPAECAVATTSRVISPGDSDITDIGSSFNSSCWIVNPNNHHQLQPIGAIGELMIGGRNVGRGYINRPVETKEKFIQNPTWASDFGLVKDTRFYKTGDLARYTPDGTLQLMGRKDTQVKLNGQRIELQEIEHTSENLLGTSAIADLVALQGWVNSKIVLFVCSTGAKSFEAGQVIAGDGLFIPPNGDDIFQFQPLRSHLEKVLPHFMIPSVIIPIQTIPLTAGGKTDRKVLREEASKIDRATLECYMGPSTKKRGPSSKEELFVRRAFAEILSLDECAIGVDDSFFTLGGDSISAMQVLAICKRGNLLLNMPDFLVHNSVARFCENAKIMSSQNVDARPERETGGLFELSPTQKMFFTRSPRVDTRFNQSFFVKLNRTFTLPEWQGAIEQVIQHHSMLRARFVQGDDQRWRQIITSDARGSFRLAEHDLILAEEIHEIRRKAHSSLNIKNGPVFSLDLIRDTTNGHHALFIGHHLVVDLVSWRIILGDIQDLLERQPLPKTTPFAFQEWVRCQAEHAQGYKDLQSMLPCGVRFADYKYWGITQEQNSFGEATHRDFVIDQATTTALLGDANLAFSTQPQELFQAALLHSWMNIFKDRDSPTIFTESHGRHPWKVEIDLSRTVGWFTTISPCTVSRFHDRNLPEIVRRVKDTCRRIPEQGMLHFISHFLNSGCEDNPSHPGNRMEVLMNYSGRYQQLERQGAIFSQPTQKFSDDMDIAEDMPRFAVFDVSIEVISGCLNVSVWYCKHTHRLGDINRWIEDYQQSLYGVAQQLTNIGPQLTLSDIPLSNMTYDELRVLENKVSVQVMPASNSIESIYPCSDAHVGLIEGFAKSSAEHRVRSIWEIQSSQKLSPAHVANAWCHLVKRHSILRAILLACPIRGKTTFHVVLKEAAAAPDIKILTHPAEDSLKELRELQPLASWDNSPPHFLAVYQAANGRLLCKLESGKAIIDAASLSVLLHELCLFLQGKSPTGSSSAPSYKSYISYLKQISSVSKHQKYWQNALFGLKPSLFPHLLPNTPTLGRVDSITRTIEETDKLSAFWRSNSITATNVFQLAWAMVLHHYTGLQDVCFGALVSGRDIALPDISQLVGPCFNVLPCRLKLDPERTVLDILRDNQQAMQHRVEHQHCSVPDMLRETGLSKNGQLFNTCLSVQPSLSATSEKEHEENGASDKVEFKLIDNHDPSEFDICIAIFLSSKSLEIDLRYWTSMFSKEQAEVIQDQLVTAIFQIRDFSRDTLNMLAKTRN